MEYFLAAKDHRLSFQVAGVPQADRAPLDTMSFWVRSLWNDVFLHQVDDAEYREVGPEITMLSWYLHDVDYRQCLRPRWISLGIEYEDWTSDLQECWRDVIDYDLPLDVVLVHPEPPRAVGENHQGHLLLVQRALRPMDTAILLTSQLLDFRSRLHRQALFAGPHVNHDDLIRLGGLVHDCTVLGCTTMATNEVIVDEPYALREGEGIIIYGEPRAHPAPRGLRTELMELEDDEIDLMQTPSEAAPSSSAGQGHFGVSHYTASAPTQHPWNDGRYPDWTTELWEQVYSPQAEEWTCADEPTVELLTWFLDDGHHQSCRAPRVLHFDADWWTWPAKLEALWRDLMTAHRPYSVHLVFPEPPRGTLEYHQAHVLVSQVDDAHRVVLLSAFFETAGPRQIWQCALRTPATINRGDILDQVTPARSDLSTTMRFSGMRSFSTTTW